MFAVLLLNLVQVAAVPPDSLVLADFSDTRESVWFPVNDGVMGGVSQSIMQITSDGTGVFTGRSSLANNGGFASVRTEIGSYNLSPFAGLAIRVRGDGRRYQVRLRTGGPYRSLAYKAEFDTKAGAWITIQVGFAHFMPTLRGFVPRSAPPLDLSAVGELGLLLADGQPGPFRLEVERITAVRKPQSGR